MHRASLEGRDSRTCLNYVGLKIYCFPSAAAVVGPLAAPKAILPGAPAIPFNRSRKSLPGFREKLNAPSSKSATTPGTANSPGIWRSEFWTIQIVSGAGTRANSQLFREQFIPKEIWSAKALPEKQSSNTLTNHTHRVPRIKDYPRGNCRKLYILPQRLDSFNVDAFWGCSLRGVRPGSLAQERGSVGDCASLTQKFAVGVASGSPPRPPVQCDHEGPPPRFAQRAA